MALAKLVTVLRLTFLRFCTVFGFSLFGRVVGVYSGSSQGYRVGHVVRVYGTKASKMSQKACLEFVAAPQLARAARKHRSRVGRTPWHPGSAADRPDRVGSTPRSLWGCHKLAAERATEGVLAEVVEFEN